MASVSPWLIPSVTTETQRPQCTVPGFLPQAGRWAGQAKRRSDDISLNHHLDAPIELPADRRVEPERDDAWRTSEHERWREFVRATEALDPH